MQGMGLYHGRGCRRHPGRMGTMGGIRRGWLVTCHIACAVFPGCVLTPQHHGKHLGLPLPSGLSGYSCITASPQLPQQALPPSQGLPQDILEGKLCRLLFFLILQGL